MELEKLIRQERCSWRTLLLDSERREGQKIYDGFNKYIDYRHTDPLPLPILYRLTAKTMNGILVELTVLPYYHIIEVKLDIRHALLRKELEETGTFLSTRWPVSEMNVILSDTGQVACSRSRLLEVGNPNEVYIFIDTWAMNSPIS